MNLMAFIEMYHTGGGTRYMIDCLNALPAQFSDITLSSNLGSLLPEDELQLKRAIKTDKTFFISYNRIYQFCQKHFSPQNILLRILLKFSQLFEILFIFLNIPLLCCKLYRKKPDIIWAFNGGYPASLATLACLIAGRTLKIPVILSIVSIPSRRTKRHEAFLDKIAWACCSAIVVNCKAIQEKLCLNRNAPSTKITIVHNTVPPQPKTICPSTLPSHSAITIGFFSRIESEKGIFILFEAFKNLLSKYPTLRLCFIGDGSALEALTQRVSQAQLSSQIDIHGYFNDSSAKAMDKFDIFVLPSMIEGLPYALLEAMSCGKPIIASRVGGIPEVISHDVDGLLISPESVAACETALNTLISDPSKMRLIATKALQKYDTLISPDCFKRKITSVLDKLFLQINPAKV